MQRQGFTLVEVTITLVIIAVIAAGVIATRSIIRTSELQAVMTEYELYRGAVGQFYGKYQALPGDFRSATGIWGEISLNCRVGAISNTDTCNGDGDEVIEPEAPDYEHILAWRHLGLSGFINQNLNGNVITSTVCSIDIKGGENVPASRLEGGMWHFTTAIAGTAYTTGTEGSQFIPLDAGNDPIKLQTLWFGGSLQDDDVRPASCAHTQIPAITGEEALALDQKFDDGRAGSGNMRAQLNNSALFTTCYDATSANGQYKTNANGVNCSLAFPFVP